VLGQGGQPGLEVINCGLLSKDLIAVPVPSLAKRAGERYIVA
jgi:hypothetical protein